MAIRIDATGEYLERTTDLIDYNGPYTWMAWVYRIGTGTWQSLYSVGINSGAWEAPYYESGGWNMYVNSVSGGITGTFAANTWYNVCVVRSSATLVTLYVDGVSTVTNTTNVTGRTAPSAMRIPFRPYTTTGDPFDGRQFGHKIWTRALSLAEIRNEMRAAAPRARNSLYSWNPMPTGMRTRDWSGRGRHWTETGTLTNEQGPALVFRGGCKIVQYVAPAGGGTIPPIYHHLQQQGIA